MQTTTAQIPAALVTHWYLGHYMTQRIPVFGVEMTPGDAAAHDRLVWIQLRSDGAVRFSDANCRLDSERTIPAPWYVGTHRQWIERISPYSFGAQDAGNDLIIAFLAQLGIETTTGEG